jgi:hypothetical protein
MFAVALVELATSPEEAATFLAHEVGLSPYDLRLRFAGGLPAVVLLTPHAAAAESALRAMRARGHGAVVCDLKNVVPSTSMVAMRHFAFDDEAMCADRGSPEVLPYRNIQLFVHAAHPEVHQVIDHELVYVSPREGVRRREKVTSEHENSQSLYIFRNDGEKPWILRQHDAQYAALGEAFGPVQQLNFIATIGALRARAPHAHFDDRLVLRPRSPEHFGRSFGHPADRREGLPWADHGADLAAHLLATWFGSKGADPYRS